MHVVQFVGHVALAVEELGGEDVSTERTELLGVLQRAGTVDVHDPLADVAGHVVEPVVVRRVAVDRCSDIGIVVQGSGDTHVVTAGTDEVGVDFTVELATAVVVPHVVAVPRVGPAARDELLTTVSDEGQGGVLPLGLGGQAVVRKQDAVGHGHVAVAGAVGAEVLDAVGGLGGLLILSVEVGFRAEVAVVHLSGRVVDEEAFAHHDLLVYAVGPPLAEVVGLQPGDTDDRVVAVGRVAQVVVHVRLVVGPGITPHEGVGLGPVHDFREAVAIDAAQPEEVFEPVEVGHLHLVHVERADGHPAGDVVPGAGQVVLDLAHGERAAFDEHEAGAGFLSDVGEALESTVLRVVVGPTGRARRSAGTGGEEGGGQDGHAGEEEDGMKLLHRFLLSFLAGSGFRIRGRAGCGT